ncbi:MAG: hypothetical protein FVQ79_05925 [Planctomycetes bacterium]|nr:hypothetical protein [Planctomycetota bacterium]
MKTRKCNKCGKTKELVRENFRFADNSYMRTCLDCVRKARRKKCHLKAATNSTTDELLSKRCAMKAKYDKIFVLEDQKELPAEGYIDIVLGSRGRRNDTKILEDQLDLNSHIREEKMQDAIEKYDKVFKISESTGVSINASGNFVDKVLEKVEEKLNRRIA